MKVFFDIGTNNFQGYDELSRTCNIDETWFKVFVEPNPYFPSDEKWIEKLNSIPNSEFFQAALCCDCSGTTADLMFIENMPENSISANIFNESWRHKSETKKIEVNIVTFDEISEKYKDHEWYIKFDCEHCEFSCLNDIIINHNKNVQDIWCEFHTHDSVGHADWKDEKAKSFRLAKDYGVRLHDWK